MAKKKKSMKDRVKKVAAQARERTGVGSINLPEDMDFWKEKKGRNLIDIIPYEVSIPNHPDGAEPGELWYRMPYKVHFVGFGDNMKSYVCPGTIGRKCPICEYVAQAMKKGTLDDDAIASLKPKSRVLYNIIPRGKRDEQEVHVWDISYYNFQQQLDEEIDEGEEDWAGFADLEDGYTLKVRFSEQKFGKRTFYRASRIDFVKRDDYDEDILDDVVQLDSALNILSYKELEKKFLELDDEDEEEEKVEPVEDVDRDDEKEEDEPPFDPDEEEQEERKEEKPRRERKRRSRKKREDEEEKRECPHGHVFGDDFDEYDECDDCKIWKYCMKESEKK